MCDSLVKPLLIALLVLLGGCAVEGGSLASIRQFGGNQDSVPGLIGFYRESEQFRGERYLDELASAREKFGRDPDLENRLRLSILLMNRHSSNAEMHYEEAETLLEDYVQEAAKHAADEDFTNLAAMLLSINRDWQRMNRELVAAQMEAEVARKKLDELKAIEIRLNHPDNGYH